MATKLAKIVADFRTSLASAIAVGGTTATLQSITDDDGNTIANGTYFFTLDKNSSKKEHIVCTVTGTALSSIKTITRQGVQSVGVARAHRIGASVVITDFSHIRYINDLLDGTTNLNASTPLKYDGTATISHADHLATKAYVDGVAVAGAPDADTTTKGIIEIATAAERAAGTATGGTGAILVPSNDSLVKTSSGAGDENKIPVLDASGTLANGFIDKARTWGTVQSFTADNAQITSDANSANDAIRKSYLDSSLLSLKFGDGSDGAFSSAAGTTTLNTVGKNIYQYTSFSLTGTADLTIGSNLQNSPVYIFVQGNLTITSATVPAVNVNGRGGSGGAGGTAPPNSGVAGTVSAFGIESTLNSGQGGTGGANNTCGGGGGGGAAFGTNGADGTNGAIPGALGAGGIAGSYFNDRAITAYLVMASPGSGGGGGGIANNGGATANGGNGAAGGGCIIFVVGGDINITSTFQATGSNGSNGAVNGGFGSGGGGGGGGGFIGVFYAGSVTANTATFTVTGGTGGTGGAAANAGGNGGAGATGKSLVKKILIGALGL